MGKRRTVDGDSVVHAKIQRTRSIDLFVKWRPAGLTGQLFAVGAWIPTDPI